MEDLIKEFGQLKEEITGNKNIIVNQFDINEQPADELDISDIEERKTISQSFIDFYKQLNGVTISWSPSSEEDEFVEGKVKILQFYEVFTDWKGIVFFDDTPSDDPIQKFFPFDFFADEACAGIYSTPAMSPNVFFYQFDDHPFDLGLDMNGYCTMLIASKGFRYWQLVIKTIITGETNTIYEKFAKYMPVLFPDFNLNNYISLYKKVSLTK